MVFVKIDVDSLFVLYFIKFLNIQLISRIIRQFDFIWEATCLFWKQRENDLLGNFSRFIVFFIVDIGGHVFAKIGQVYIDHERL